MKHRMMGQITLFDTKKTRIYNSCTPIPIHKISEFDDSTNRLGIMGAEICCEMNNKQRKKNYLLQFLTGLRLDYGWRLDRKLTLNTNSIGDSCHIYTVNENGEIDYDELSYLKRFRVINEDGFWQLYLLHIAETVMPAYWHGLYLMRGYIFTLNDLKYLEYLSNEEKKILSQKKLLLPKVKIQENGATIKVTYWADNDGLCRETVKILVDENSRMTSIKTIKREVISKTYIQICY